MIARYRGKTTDFAEGLINNERRYNPINFSRQILSGLKLRQTFAYLVYIVLFRVV